MTWPPSRSRISRAARASSKASSREASSSSTVARSTSQVKPPGIAEATVSTRLQASLTAESRRPTTSRTPSGMPSSEAELTFEVQRPPSR